MNEDYSPRRGPGPTGDLVAAQARRVAGAVNRSRAPVPKFGSRRTLRIIAQDPSVRRANREVVTAHMHAAEMSHLSGDYLRQHAVRGRVERATTGFAYADREAAHTSNRRADMAHGG